MTGGLTVRQYWEWLSGGPVSQEVLGWAPDVAALTSALLERSHAFRFVVSPPVDGAWPPPGQGPFAGRVATAAEQWRAAMESGGEAPAEVRHYWRTLAGHLDTPVADVAQGRPWELCEAALALHAMADEACADGPGGAVFRAQAQELLARTGSMASLPVDRIAQLPKSRTTSVGITHRSLSRYTCTTTDGIGIEWDRVPIRRRGTRPITRHANILLLPWPLRIRETDFVPVPGSVRRPEREPFGFFTYEPSEPLDLGLVDRLLDAAREEVDDVDVVVLPEGCLDERDVDALEALLAAREVPMLVTGLRPTSPGPDRFAGNSVHTGVLAGGSWWHYRQDKHHRWFLDGSQIETYNIAGALHPSVRWWEAMEIPARQVHLVDLGGKVTVAAVICEDLARLDGVAQLLRSVGPTLVLTLLLDGPQLASRWTARYAGVLADDPGSAVLTLTALGMASRSQPPGMPPSRVIAMWKDPTRGVREIPLEPGAQAVLLKAVLDSSPRHAADGRLPTDDATDLYVAGVHQLRAGPPLPEQPPAMSTAQPALAPRDLTVLTVWAQAVAEAGPDAAAVVAAAQQDAPWRTRFGLQPPRDDLAEALAALGHSEGDSPASQVAHTCLRAARAAEDAPPV